MTKQEIENLKFLTDDINRLNESVKDDIFSNYLEINHIHDKALVRRLKEFISKERDSLQKKLNSIEIKGL